MASLDQNFYNTTALGTPIDPPDDSDDNLIDTPHSPLVSPEILESFFVTQAANPPGDLPLDGNLPVKKKFTDLLEENGTDSVQDDVITKIFSQTIQVPTSDEATPTTDEEEDKEQGETEGKEEVDCSELKIQTRDKSPLMMGQTTPTIVIDTCTWTNGNEEDSDSDPPDKVPHNLAHFNETICDDEDEDLDHHHQVGRAAEETIQNSYDNEQSDVRLEQPNSDPQSEELIPEPNPEEDDIQEFEATERKIELEEFENEKNLRNISYDSPNHDDFIIRNDQSEVNSEPVTEEMPNDSYYKEDATEEEKSTTDGLVRRETKSTTTSSVSSSTKTTTIKRSVASKIESLADEETVETEIITTEMEEAQQTQGSTNKKKRKSKKLKNSDGPEKENISVVQNHDSLISSNGFYDDEKSEDSLREPEPRTFTSVRQLRKFYQERCRMEKERSENKRNSNCDNELTNTRYSVKSLESQFSNKPTNDLSSSTLPRTVVARWPPQSKTQIIQKSKSISDLRSSEKSGGNRPKERLKNGVSVSNVGAVGLGRPSGVSRSFFFLKKILFFENRGRCTSSNDEDEGVSLNHWEPPLHCPYCGHAPPSPPTPLRDCYTGSDHGNTGPKKPPSKIRINVMQFDMKSSFSKFDALQKKAAAAAAAANALIPSGSTTNILATTGQEAAVCAACGKTVYQMEQIKAEMRFWHRNCFRCSTCQKPLSVDTYQSHEAILYCKPHFKQLFHPKAVLEDENEEQANQNKGRVGRLPEMIIRENQPAALPEGVVRATDKVDDGLSLDDLQRLSNVKQAFKMFESRSTEEELVETSSHKVEKSPSILNKLAHFQNKMNGKGRGRKKERVGVTANDLNGEPRNDVSGSSSCISSEDEDEPPEGVDVDLWRARKAVKSSDQIVHCSDLDDLKRKFEANSYETERQDRQEERKEELKKIRSRLFMGKQARIKEQYQQAVMDSEFVSHLETESTGRKVLDDPSGVVAPGNIREKMQLLNEGGVSVEPTSPTHAKQRLMEQRSESLMELEELRQKKKQTNLDIKSKFESGTGGSTSPKPNSDDPELMQQIVEHGIAKTSRNLFLELDKQVSQTGPISPLLQPASAALRKSNSQLIKAGLREDGTQAEVVNKEGGLEKTTEAAIVIDTKDLQKKFEFFEKYQEAPKPKKEILITKSRDTKSQKEMWERQVSESANAQVRQEMPDEGKEVAMESHTARKMLNLFREIESGVGQKGDQTEGPRPLKAFTPPPDGGRRLLAGGNQNGENGGGEEEEEESDAGVTDNSDIESEDEEELKKNYIKYDDEILQQAKAAARAKKLRAKFEKWETEQIRLEEENGVGMQQTRRLWESNESHSLESNTNATNGDAVDANQLESAKNLRQKFEFMAKSGGNQPTSPRGVKINRFV